MGYEIKLYVVEPSCKPYEGKFSKRKSDGEYTQVFNGGISFEKDGDTHAEVEDEFVIRSYSSKIAMVDLCKPGYSSNIYQCMKNAQETSNYFYSEDGNTPIIVDRYGELLAEVDLEAAIEALKKDLVEDKYRRFKTALALLESCREDYFGVKVVFFGY